MNSVDNYNLWKFPAKIDPFPDSLIFFRKNLLEIISCINSRSLSSSHYMVTEVTYREQYDKGSKWI